MVKLRNYELGAVGQWRATTGTVDAMTSVADSKRGTEWWSRRRRCRIHWSRLATDMLHVVDDVRFRFARAVLHAVSAFPLCCFVLYAASAYCAMRFCFCPLFVALSHELASNSQRLPMTDATVSFHFANGSRTQRLYHLVQINSLKTNYYSLEFPPNGNCAHFENGGNSNIKF